MCGTRSRSDICAQVAWRWCGSWGKWRGSSKSWPGGVLYGEPGGAVHGDCLWHQGGGCPSWGRSSKERAHVAAEGQVVFQVWVQKQINKAKLRKLNIYFTHVWTHTNANFRGCGECFPWNEMKLPIVRILCCADTVWSTSPLNCSRYLTIIIFPL